MIPGCSRQESVGGVAPTLNHLDLSRGGGRDDTSLSHAPLCACLPHFLLSLASLLHYKGLTGSTALGLSPARLMERRRGGDAM